MGGISLVALGRSRSRFRPSHCIAATSSKQFAWLGISPPISADISIPFICFSTGINGGFFSGFFFTIHSYLPTYLLTYPHNPPFFFFKLKIHCVLLLPFYLPALLHASYLAFPPFFRSRWHFHHRYYCYHGSSGSFSLPTSLGNGFFSNGTR